MARGSPCWFSSAAITKNPALEQARLRKLSCPRHQALFMVGLAHGTLRRLSASDLWVRVALYRPPFRHTRKLIVHGDARLEIVRSFGGSVLAVHILEGDTLSVGQLLPQAVPSLQPMLSQKVAFGFHVQSLVLSAKHRHYVHKFAGTVKGAKFQTEALPKGWQAPTGEASDVVSFLWEG